MKTPQDCQSMAELRAQIDALDAELIGLLAKRAGYIDRAVILKTKEGLPPRTADRVAQVLAHVEGLAAEAGLDPQLAHGLWSLLIDWGIAREEDLMRRLHM